MSDLDQVSKELEDAQSGVKTAETSLTMAKEKLKRIKKEQLLKEWSERIGKWYKDPASNDDRSIFRKAFAIKKDAIFYPNVEYTEVKIGRGWRFPSIECTTSKKDLLEEDIFDISIPMEKEQVEKEMKTALLMTRSINVEGVEGFLYFDDYFSAFKRLRDFCLKRERSSIALEETRSIKIDGFIPRFIMDKILHKAGIEDDDIGELYTINTMAFINKWYLFAGLGKE